MRSKAIALFLVIVFVFGSVVQAEVIDRIVAIVNDEIITLVDIQSGMKPYLRNIESSEYSDEKKDELVARLKNDILDTLIERTLTGQEAKRYGIKISKKDIDKAIENIKTQQALSQKEFERALSYQGLTIEQLRDDIEQQMLHARIINSAVKSKVVITQSDIKKYYDANQNKYGGQKKHHLRNILVQDKAQGLEIRRQLDEKQPFIELAKVFSQAPNASDGGDLGTFDISNFSKEIKDSISVLKKGEYTDVVPTAQGFQIFYLEDIVLEGSISYEDASEEIQNTLYNEQVEEKFKNWLAELKDNAHIKKLN